MVVDVRGRISTHTAPPASRPIVAWLLKNGNWTAATWVGCRALLPHSTWYVSSQLSLLMSCSVALLVIGIVRHDHTHRNMSPNTMTMVTTNMTTAPTVRELQQIQQQLQNFNAGTRKLGQYQNFIEVVHLCTRLERCFNMVISRHCYEKPSVWKSRSANSVYTRTTSDVNAKIHEVASILR